jgi:hypothetical protein
MTRFELAPSMMLVDSQEAAFSLRSSQHKLHNYRTAQELLAQRSEAIIDIRTHTDNQHTNSSDFEVKRASQSAVVINPGKKQHNNSKREVSNYSELMQGKPNCDKSTSTMNNHGAKDQT